MNTSRNSSKEDQNWEVVFNQTNISKIFWGKKSNLTYGVQQHNMTLKDFFVISFVFLLWIYSLLLFYKKYLIIVGGEDGGSSRPTDGAAMWKAVMDFVRNSKKDDSRRASNIEDDEPEFEQLEQIVMGAELMPEHETENDQIINHIVSGQLQVIHHVESEHKELSHYSEHGHEDLIYHSDHSGIVLGQLSHHSGLDQPQVKDHNGIERQIKRNHSGHSGLNHSGHSGLNHSGHSGLNHSGHSGLNHHETLNPCTNQSVPSSAAAGAHQKMSRNLTYFTSEDVSEITRIEETFPLSEATRTEDTFPLSETSRTDNTLPASSTTRSRTDATYPESKTTGRQETFPDSECSLSLFWESNSKPVHTPV